MMVIKRVLILLLLLVTLPGFVLAQMVSIKAGDGNVYQISAPKKLGTAFGVVNPSQFQVFDKKGEAVAVSAKTAGELYSAHEALAGFGLDKGNSVTNKIVDDALGAARLDVATDGLATIAGVASGIAVGAVEGAVIGAVIGGVGTAPAGGVGAAPVAAAGAIGGALFAGVDGVSTIVSTWIESDAKKTIAYTALLEAEIEENMLQTVNLAEDVIASDLKAGRVVDLKDIKDIVVIKGAAKAHGEAAMFAANSLENDISSSDTAMNYLSNAQPGLSTAKVLYDLVKNASDESSDSFQLKAEKAVSMLALEADKKGAEFRDELFEDPLTVAYMEINGFFANQQSLVDQLNAEKAADADRDLAKLEQQAKIEQAAAQKSTIGNATIAGVNDGRDKLASIIQEKQSNAPRADFSKSDKDNADSIKDYWNEQIKILKKKKGLYQSARTSALTKKGQAEKSRDSCRARGCDSKSLKFYEDQVLKHSKTVGYYHGLLGSTTKDGVDALIVWAEAKYEAAKQQYRIAKKQERARTAAIERQQELDQVLAEAEKLAAEEAEKKYDYRDYETGKDDGYVTIMPVVPSSGQQEHTIPQERLDDKQNDEIGSGTTFQPTSPGSQPQLVAGQFRVTPGRFRSEDFDLNAIVKATFGDNYRIADWNEFVAAYNADAEGLKNQMTEYHGNNLMVTRNGIHSAGTSNYGGGSFERQYYITYHNGTVPSYYAVYDHVGNHDYDLGSWIANSPILAVKIDSSQSDIDPSQWSGGPTVPTIWEGFGAYHHDTGVSPVAIAINLDPVNHEIQSVIKTATNQSLYIYDSYYQNKNSFGFTAFRQAPANSHDEGIEGLWAVTAPDADLHDYDYTTWGYWQQNVTNRNDKTADSPWVIGQLTPDNSIPTSGTATYIGNARGIVSDGVRDNSGVRGSVSLQANLSSRTLNGQISDMRFEDGSAWKTLNVSAAWAGGSNSIAGAITAPGTTGTVQGRFFGPQAEEMGGYWETTSGAELANGTFQAKK